MGDMKKKKELVKAPDPKADRAALVKNARKDLAEMDSPETGKLARLVKTLKDVKRRK